MSPAETMASKTILLTVASLIMNFEWFLPNNDIDPCDINMEEEMHAPMYKKEPLHVNFMLREGLYGEEYLRRPTQSDVEKLYTFHENKHGFPGMIGSIDCTKWLWAQCPQAYRAQFSRGDSGPEPFILLEAVASQDLWIWYAFFGVAGSNNDVNVLRQSSVLNGLKVGKAPEVPFVANDVTYKWGYYLTDGIYPEWAVLIKSISQPGSNDVKRIIYKQEHEAARKDVERAFGMLKKKMGYQKGKAISPDFYPEQQHREDDPVRSAQDRLRVIRQMHDEETHLNLKADLVEYI
ncbi:ALP1-like protein [Tanacetum coccineum]